MRICRKSRIEDFHRNQPRNSKFGSSRKTDIVYFAWILECFFFVVVACYDVCSSTIQKAAHVGYLRHLWLRELAVILRHTFFAPLVSFICMQFDNTKGSSYWISTSRVVTRTWRNITSYVHCPSCFIYRVMLIYKFRSITALGFLAGLLQLMRRAVTRGLRLLFGFGVTAPSGSWPPHSRSF